MIEFQQQPTPNTCTSACLAMILGVPVQDVIDVFHGAYVDGDTDASKFLNEAGIDHEIGNPFMKVNTAGLWLLCVPSLNIQAGNHNILYLMIPAPESGEGFFYQYLFDPAKGREDRKYYKLPQDEDNNPLAVNLYGRCVDLVIRDWEKYAT